MMKYLPAILAVIYALHAGPGGPAAIAPGVLAPQERRGESFWEGSYEFGEDGGRNAGGAVIYVQHSLVIRREGESLVAEIESNGYQTARQLVGSVDIKPGAARIYFKRYGETNSFKPYREGELLLTLRRTYNRGRGPRVLTYWGAFQPAVSPLPSGRVYFSKKR